jgi:choline dehydrogenase-like flavoprotein
VRRRPNLIIRSGAHVKRVVIEQGRATGIEYLRGERAELARAQREVVLAAGAIGSPHLLQVSGVGPRALLATLGIPAVAPLEGVGANLQDHLQMRLAFRVRGVRTLNEQTHSLIGKALMGLEYLLRRSGPLAMAPSQLGAFTRSDPSQETPNLEYHIQPVSLDKFGEPLHPFPAFTASVCNLRPTSRGSVRAVNPDSRTPPAIEPRYLSTEDDRRVSVAAIRLTRQIVATDALKRYEPREFKPGPEYVSDADLVKAAGDIGTTIFHPVGTCKMGLDAQAVVDPRLRVRGVRDLRVVDASIMPTITSGNTNAPALMIAEKGSAMILEDQKAAR